MAATLAGSHRLVKADCKRLKAERAALERQHRADEVELRDLVAAGAENSEVAHLAEIQERTARTDRRMAEIENDFTRLAAQEITEARVTVALAEFDAVWKALKSSEQVAILNLLVERVVYDASQRNIAITFRSMGLKTFIASMAQHEETVA